MSLIRGFISLADVIVPTIPKKNPLLSLLEKSYTEEVDFSFLHRRHSSAGTVLLTTLVTFLIFLVVMIASVRYINSQFFATVNEEQQTKAFEAAEAGVQQTLFLLRSSAQTFGTFLAMTGGLSGTVNDPDSGSGVTTYEVAFAAGETDDDVTVTSVGYDASSSSRCFTVTAGIERQANNVFVINSWQTHSGC